MFRVHELKRNMSMCCAVVACRVGGGVLLVKCVFMSTLDIVLKVRVDL